MWGIALVAHVVGNWALADLPGPLGWVNLAVGLLGIGLALRPRRPLLAAASLLVVISLALEIPVLGNHWLVAGLVSLAILFTGVDEGRFTPAARLVLVVFYALAAFAKLNHGFLDPEVSCASVYLNQWLGGVGLGPVPMGSVATRAAVWGSVLVELSVPLLLLVRRWRPWGVLVATGFHTLISFDLNQHFYDFTAVLLPLFFLFASDRTAERVLELWSSAPVRVRRFLSLGLAGVGGLLVVAAILPPWLITLPLVTVAPFFLWIPFAIWWLWGLIRATAPAEALPWRLQPLAWVVVILTFLNGLTPYTEVKTAFSFNMYANLITANGESNHLIVRRTFPIRDGYRRPVKILDSSDPGLRTYADQGYLIPYSEFRRYLTGRPQTMVTYVRDGVTHVVDSVGDDPELSSAPRWWEILLPLRSIDQGRPPRCQEVFLGAL
jgi:hypothetical protein